LTALIKEYAVSQGQMKINSFSIYVAEVFLAYQMLSD
jgi:hypothetical protein